MRKFVLIATTSAALIAPPVSGAAPLPDASPQAHGRHVTVLPACPNVPLPWNMHYAYLEGFKGGKIVCASEEHEHYAASMTFS